MIDFVIPVHCKSAPNVRRVVSRLSRCTRGQGDLRFNIVCDLDDSSFASLSSLVFPASLNVRIFSTQSYVNESAFLSAISQCKFINKSRYKWYWQQFKKLLSFQIPAISEKIVLWDSDTFPIGKQVFFDGDLPICQKSRAEYHVPYFMTFANLAGRLVLPPHSSIAQYCPVYASELNHMALIFAYGHTNKVAHAGSVFTGDMQPDYFRRIFSSLAASSACQSLFADYEYINLYRYLMSSPFVFSDSKHFRHGGYLLMPKAVALMLLKWMGYSNVSYESYHPADRLKRFLGLIEY